MAGKKKKSGKKPKGPNRGPMQGLNGGDDVSAMGNNTIDTCSCNAPDRLQKMEKERANGSKN